MPPKESYEFPSSVAFGERCGGCQLAHDIQESPMSLSSSFDSEVADYRSVSRLAVISILLGITSALALVHPVLWAVPVLAVCVALMALRQIERASGTLSGRTLAIVGMTAAVLFGVCAVSKFYGERYLLWRNGKQAADRWVEMMQRGQFRYAHQWGVAHLFRVPPGFPVDDYYKPGEDGEAEYDLFVSQQPIKTLMQLNEDDRLRYVGYGGYYRLGNDEFMTFHYQLERQNAEPFDFTVQVRRYTDRDPPHLQSWRVNALVRQDLEHAL
jgi:hypothetical protein